MTDEPDHHLLHAAQNGDHKAMNALLTPWNDVVFGFLLHMLRSREDAEDATQETFMRIVKGLPRYEHRGEFRAWIFRIARNQAALTGKRRRRIADRETGGEPELLAAFSADEEEDVMAAAERAATLRAAVIALPAAEREVVELRLNEDLKFREISQRTGAPLNTVLGRMHNAIRRLRAMLPAAPP